MARRLRGIMDAMSTGENGRSRKVLVTGAAGYIGSHTCVVLLEAGWDVVGVDNFDNSSPVALERVAELAGRPIDFVEADLRDSAAIDAIFAEHDVDAVIHFAGLKAVGQSVAEPLLYHDTNVGSTISLLGAMTRAGVFDLVFSSSCTVYGSPDVDAMPLIESSPTNAVSPYGRTKLFIEEMLQDVAATDQPWRVLSLRYFNPVGAHPSGRIGEDPVGIPNNLMPYAMQVAVGVREELSVFGGDYPTPDGTCIRDYIHVVDVAEGHLAALDALDTVEGFEPINLGTGVGSSVLEVVAAAGRAVGTPVAHRIVDRRPGDAVTVYADPAAALQRLGWKATRDLDDICVDHWRWQQKNPNGYR